MLANEDREQDDDRQRHTQQKQQNSTTHDHSPRKAEVTRVGGASCGRAPMRDRAPRPPTFVRSSDARESPVGPAVIRSVTHGNEGTEGLVHSAS
jgi:hypothetical protein